jgi:predicted lipoprotein with Yx(FWY)xxD motif
MRRAMTVAVLATAVTGLVVSGAGATRVAAKTKSVVISTRSVHGLGNVLVDAQGRTLYMFVPDKRAKVTCTGSCAAIWPPVKLAAGAKAVAKGKAEAKLLGSDRDPSGGRVVTYDGWPLYTYVTDSKAGAATGQALKLNGGYWYVLSPAGKVIKKKA